MRPVQRPEDLPWLDTLFQICHDADGHWPLGEHKYLGLVQGDDAASIGIVAEADDDSATIIGYGHLSPNRDDTGWGLELAFHPLWRSDTFLEELVHAAIEAVRTAGGDSLRLWVFRPSVAGALTSLGFNPSANSASYGATYPLSMKVRRWTRMPSVPLLPVLTMKRGLLSTIEPSLVIQKTVHGQPRCSPIVLRNRGLVPPGF